MSFWDLFRSKNKEKETAVADSATGFVPIIVDSDSSNGDASQSSGNDAGNATSADGGAGSSGGGGASGGDGGGGGI